jgi:hypothetical protein
MSTTTATIPVVADDVYEAAPTIKDPTKDKAKLIGRSGLIRNTVIERSPL